MNQELVTNDDSSESSSTTESNTESVIVLKLKYLQKGNDRIRKLIFIEALI
jgi:hypothetical protein